MRVSLADAPVKKLERSLVESNDDDWREPLLSAEGLQQAVTRMMTDRDFRYYAQTRPTEALRGFDLTPEEAEAIVRRDLFRLEELGLEPWTARWVTSLR